MYKTFQEFLRFIIFLSFLRFILLICSTHFINVQQFCSLRVNFPSIFSSCILGLPIIDHTRKMPTNPNSSPKHQHRRPALCPLSIIAHNLPRLSCVSATASRPTRQRRIRSASRRRRRQNMARRKKWRTAAANAALNSHAPPQTCPHSTTSRLIDAFCGAARASGCRCRRSRLDLTVMVPVMKPQRGMSL